MKDIFAQTYGVELLAPDSASLAVESLTRQVARFCPTAVPRGVSTSGPHIFHHPNHLIKLADATIPAQTVVMVADHPPAAERYATALHQTWAFPDAAETLAKARHSVFVTDLMTAGLAYQQRLAIFQEVLRGVLEAYPCTVMYWTHADRLVEPQAWKAQYDGGVPSELTMAGAVSVRLFRVDDAPAGPAFVMDTLGLGALGLMDLQCHFQGLDPNQMARLLYNTAWYVFSENATIEDGHTIEGLSPGSRWRCRHEHSLVEPTRVVVDLDPGPPHQAGSRG